MSSALRFRERIEAVAIWSLRTLLAAVPVRWASDLGGALGWLLYRLGMRRRRTLEMLTLAYGDELSAERRKQIAARCYRHIGALMAEFAVQPRITGSRLADHITLENPELLGEHLAAGNGLLLLLGHHGHFELMGAAVAACGYPLTAYVGQQHNPAGDAFINDVRRGAGIGTVPKQSGMRGMLRAIKENRILAIVGDQHFSRNRHFVRFFGKPVSVAPGMASLIGHTGVPAVFAETVKVGRFRYRTRFTSLELPPATGNAEYDLLCITQAFFDLLEGAVRRNPEQYFWMHKRWREPPGEDRLTAANRAFLAGEPPPEA